MICEICVRLRFFLWPSLPSPPSLPSLPCLPTLPVVFGRHGHWRFLPGFCESAMSAESAVSARSFWPTRALVKTTGSGEATEITEITVSILGGRGDLGGLRASDPGEVGNRAQG